jgi:hypothetical protein
MLTSSLILFRQIFVICLLSLFVNATGVADSSIAAVNTEHGLAVKGYDPVSYFTTGEANPRLGPVFHHLQWGNLSVFLSGKP